MQVRLPYVVMPLLLLLHTSPLEKCLTAPLPRGFGATTYSLHAVEGLPSARQRHSQHPHRHVHAMLFNIHRTRYTVVVVVVLHDACVHAGRTCD